MTPEARSVPVSVFICRSPPRVAMLVEVMVRADARLRPFPMSGTAGAGRLFVETCGPSG